MTAQGNAADIWYLIRPIPTERHACGSAQYVCIWPDQSTESLRLRHSAAVAAIAGTSSTCYTGGLPWQQFLHMQFPTQHNGVLVETRTQP